MPTYMQKRVVKWANSSTTPLCHNCDFSLILMPPIWTSHPLSSPGNMDLHSFSSSTGIVNRTTEHQQQKWHIMCRNVLFQAVKEMSPLLIPFPKDWTVNEHVYLDRSRNNIYSKLLVCSAHFTLDSFSNLGQYRLCSAFDTEEWGSSNFIAITTPTETCK